MISINLIPEKKAWFPFWVLFDLSIIALVAGLGFVVLTKFKTDVDLDLDNARATLAEVESDIGDLDPMTEKYQELKKYEQQLAGQIDEVRTKALSQFVRYRPVILLEHLQNLKPAGLWFKSIAMMQSATLIGKDAGMGPNEEIGLDTVDPVKGIIVEGYALDNIILSDFLSSLRSTENHEVIAGDLRTNLYFRTIGLSNSHARSIELNIVDSMEEERALLNKRLASGLADIKLQRFKLLVEFGERGVDLLDRAVGQSLIIAGSEG